MGLRVVLAIYLDCPKVGHNPQIQWSVNMKVLQGYLSFKLQSNINNPTGDHDTPRDRRLMNGGNKKQGIN